MLVPKRVKHRKVQRGHLRGEAKGGKTVAFGEINNYGWHNLLNEIIILFQTVKSKLAVSQLPVT
ncbi:hypothetical protein FC35_GL001823 [Limosilactobacillus coleohominis DSM 14060]|nr:hypothetical protein FC35_GL001823 [Limosilactobacillus coleohominis DSM 14060]